MTGVVDAPDGGELMAVPLDLVNAGGAEVQPVERAKRDVEGPAQQYFYRRYVAYHQHRLTVVVSQEPVTSLVDPPGGVSEALTPRRRLLGTVLPGGHCFGPSFLNLGQGEAFPLAKVGFPQVIIGGGGQTQFSGRDGSGGGSTPQRRGDNGVDLGAGGQPAGSGSGLPGAVGAERQVAQTTEPVFW